MEPYVRSVLIVVMLFFFGLISPGPNFLVVAQAALNFGRVAGFATALGAALGDAVYASLGLFGVTRLVSLHPAMMGIELLGGLYLAWLGTRMLLPRASGWEFRHLLSQTSVSARSHFWRGLVTDLSNPKTVVFFASIFAVTVDPASSRALRGLMLFGIVLTSVLWRFFLSIIFSTSLIRRIYERTARIVERVFGVALCFFGLLLLKRAAS
jgi:amino acid exporter